MVSKREHEIIQLISTLVDYVVPKVDEPIEENSLRKPTIEKTLLQKETRTLEKTRKETKRILSHISDNDVLEEIVSSVEVGTKETIEIVREVVPTEDDSDIVITYTQTESTESLEIDSSGTYLSLGSEKSNDAAPYLMAVTYERKDGVEKLTVSYDLRNYPEDRERLMNDFTSVVDKTLHIMPKNGMGSVLGFTYLGENFMARRDDLFGETALMVDVHEAIHTPDEYETRRITDWILEKPDLKYKK